MAWEELLREGEVTVYSIHSRRTVCHKSAREEFVLDPHREKGSSEGKQTRLKVRRLHFWSNSAQNLVQSKVHTLSDLNVYIYQMGG